MNAKPTFAALPFANILQLIAAFQKGAVFEIQFNDGSPPYPVTDISEESRGRLRVTYRPGHSGRTYSDLGFQADGRYSTSTTFWLRMVKDAPPQPFLKQFVNGTPAYCPKTRETVVGVSFISGAIEVLLRDESGKERVSTRYDHEGKHRWVPERSLVLGELPPKPVVMKEVTLEVFASHTRGFGLVAFESGQHGRTEAPITTVTIQVPA